MKPSFLSIIALIILCFFCAPFLKAQSNKSLNPSLDNIAPPSPNAAALAKFGSIPVGQSTGIPQVGVPVYSYESKTSGLNLSISLDYHAGGIRVDEMSSNVGIGWALNTGGVISRTMRGIYDEMEGGGFLNAPALPADEFNGNSPIVSSNCPFNDMYAWVKDSQNDIFNYSFNGRSGKFVFGKNNNFLMLNQQKLKVEKTIGWVSGSTGDSKVINKFMITDENGFQYTFDAAEITVNRSMATAAAVYTSSWYLTKIESPSKKDFITFSYENVYYTYNTGRAESSTLYYPGTVSPLPTLPGSGSIAQQSIDGKRLKSISLPNGVAVAFDYSTTERTEQTDGDYLLKKVSISYGASKRGYKLEHDNSLNRPTLKKVVPFSGAAETPDAAYEFTYDIPLPGRLSVSQDHWGYYNTNQGSLIPNEIIPVNNGKGNLGNYHETGGGDRSTDPGRVKAGSLKRVKYPTGGYTDFELEVNKAVDPRLNHKITYAKEYYSRQDVVTVYCTSTASTDKEFNFQGDLNSATEFTVKIPSTSFTCNSPCKVVLEIRNPSGIVIDRRYFDPPNSSYQPETKFTLYNLVRGVHKITSYTQGLSNYIAYIDFRWTEVRIQDPVIVTGSSGVNELYVGGLRVKRILDYDGISPTPAQVREYEYTLPDGTTSSGTLGFYPVYTTPVFYHYAKLDNGAENTYNGVSTAPNFISRSSSTLYPLAYSSGAPVAYKRVVEKITGNGVSLGRTERYFKSFDQVPYIINKPFPFTPPEYKEWINGLIERLEIYDNSNSLVKKEEYNYQYSLDNFVQDAARFESLRSVSIAPVKYLWDPGDGGVPVTPYWTYPRYFKAESFYPTAGRADLISTTSYEYDRNGGVVKTTTSNTFDPSDFYLKSTSSSTGVPGINLIKKFNYPKDMVSSGKDPAGIYQQMIDRNIINPVVEETQLRDTRQLVLQQKDFYAPFPDVYVSRTLAVKNGSFPPETRIRYDAYDVAGRVLTLSKESDIKQSYIWGYNNQYPVARIEGKSNQDAVNGSGINVAVVNDLATLDAPMRTELNKLRSLAGALVTTYTYNPLVGLTSETDPNGRTIYYEYDGFGRLKLVRDQDNNILKKLCYNYQGQIENCN